jgi:hypothetical protein
MINDENCGGHNSMHTDNRILAGTTPLNRLPLVPTIKWPKSNTDSSLEQIFLSERRKNYQFRPASFARRSRWYWKLVRDQFQCQP